MSDRPVHWHEGMFLRPQHFQAADRYWSKQIAHCAHWNNPYSYGIRRIRISTEALARFQVELTSCQAAMPDGTLVDFAAGEDPDRVDFKQEVSLEGAFDENPVIRVFLAIPRLRMGHRNVSPDGSPGDWRFGQAPLPIADQSSGGQDQEISFLELNTRIMLSTQDLSGYETLPVAQIRRGADEAGTPELDIKYFPPVLEIAAWAPLGREVIRDIYDFLGQQRGRIGSAVLDRRINLAASDEYEVDLINKLAVVNEAYSVLRILTFAEGVHPFSAYLELCRLVGRLSIWRLDRVAPEAPPYDHDDLATIFYWVKEQINESFKEDTDQYEQEYFSGLGAGMHVSIKPKWLLGEWQWYVGVARGDLSESECRQLLEPGQLNWKMGSATRVDDYWTKGVSGLQLDPVDSPPSVFPSRGGWTYFEVNREHPAFRHVQSEKSLAVLFSERYILNLTDLQGKKDLQVEVKGTRVTLQFALFALKRSGP